MHRTVRRFEQARPNDEEPKPLDQHIERICTGIGKQKKRDAEVCNDQSGKQQQKPQNRFLQTLFHFGSFPQKACYYLHYIMKSDGKSSRRPDFSYRTVDKSFRI